MARPWGLCMVFSSVTSQAQARTTPQRTEAGAEAFLLASYPSEGDQHWSEAGMGRLHLRGRDPWGLTLRPLTEAERSRPKDPPTPPGSDSTAALGLCKWTDFFVHAMSWSQLAHLSPGCLL